MTGQMCLNKTHTTMRNKSPQTNRKKIRGGGGGNEYEEFREFWGNFNGTGASAEMVNESVVPVSSERARERP